MTIIEMREKRAKLWNTMEGFLDTHRNDKGVLSAEDDATYSAMEQDLNDLSNEIRRMERRDAMEAADTFAERLPSTTCFLKAPTRTAATLCRRSSSVTS